MRRTVHVLIIMTWLVIGCRPGAASAATLPPSRVPTQAIIATRPPTVVSPVTILPTFTIAAAPYVPVSATLANAVYAPNASDINGQVAAGARGLRLRDKPNTNGKVIRYLEENDPLIVNGRTGDNAWVKVTTSEGVSGWVLTQYIEMYGDINTLAVLAQPTPASVAAANVPGNFNAKVAILSLHLRADPNTKSDVLATLDAAAPLDIVGRTSDGTWLLVTTQAGDTGWVLAQYVSASVDLGSISVADSSANSTADGATVHIPAVAPGIYNVTAHIREIFVQGQKRGNRANVFSKIGDSIFGADWYLGPFTYSSETLGGYEYLRPVIDYFSAATARDGNSFTNHSLSAHPGFSTFDVLDPGKADPTVCKPSEIPLNCEYRMVRPAFALIMIGTNDAGGIAAPDYQRNLRRIVQTTVDDGIVPVLFTLPPRIDAPDHLSLVQQYNPIIASTAGEFNIPFVDYWAAVQPLPDRGVSGDGVHPSMASWQWGTATDLRQDNLRYGFPILNLLSLEALDAVWRVSTM
jgi:uncharacterized protein YgiM (DUF1202 family)